MCHGVHSEPECGNGRVNANTPRSHHAQSGVAELTLPDGRESIRRLLENRVRELALPGFERQSHDQIGVRDDQCAPSVHSRISAMLVSPLHSARSFRASAKTSADGLSGATRTLLKIEPAFPCFDDFCPPEKPARNEPRPGYLESIWCSYIKMITLFRPKARHLWDGD